MEAVKLEPLDTCHEPRTLLRRGTAAGDESAAHDETVEGDSALAEESSGLARVRTKFVLTLLLLAQLTACVPDASRGAGAASHTPEMGIPNKVLVGAAYGGNTDPAPFEESIGGTLQIRRTYWRGDNVDSAVQTASEDVAAGRIPWLSFKLPYAWDEMAAGKGDDWAKDLTQKLAALNAPVWIAFHHEPERDGNVRQWVAMQRRLAPIVHANSDNIAFSTILTGWHQLYGDPRYSLDALYPGDGLVDIMGFDPYNEYGVVKDGKTVTNPFDFKLATLAEFAESHNAAWGLAETGYSDEAARADPQWLDRLYSDLSANGAVALTYFNTELNAYGSWLIDSPGKTQAFADILKRARE